MAEVDDAAHAYALVDGKFYPLDVVHAAMHTVVIERVKQLTRGVEVTERQLVRACRALKTPSEHFRIMQETLRRVRESGADVPAAEALSKGGAPAAVFRSDAGSST
jgi:hypothetical protein